MLRREEQPSASDALRGGVFATTHWSVILAARDEQPLGGGTSLDRICRDYWPPLYAYIRQEGHGREDAQDLTQEFFRQFLEKGWLQRLVHQDGRFRSFLLTYLKHFLSDQRDRGRALKRGGGKAFISVDQFETEEREHWEPVDHLTADQVFDRRWLQRLNEQAAARLRAEYQAGGKLELYEAFQHVERGARDGETHAALGERLGMTAAAVKSAVHRFHKRLAELLWEEVARTVGNPAEVGVELRHLLEYRR